MKTKAVTITCLAVYWFCCYFAQAAPVESEKGRDEFVFLLPAGEGGPNLFSGISVNLEPPSPFRTARDSYGNPVSPFGAADVNADNGKKILNTAGLQFEIPSYASGITEIRKPTNELLPPIASGEVPEDALQTPTVQQPPVILLPPISTAIPPNAPNAINEITDRIDSQPTDVPEPKQKEVQKEINPEDHTEPEIYEGEKYTGGFGGPPGILGEQKEKGYAIIEKEENEEKESATTDVSSDQNEDSKTSENPSIIVPTSSSVLDSQTPESALKPIQGVQSSTVFNSVFSPGIVKTDTPLEEIPIKTSLVADSVLPPSTPSLPVSSTLSDITLQQQIPTTSSPSLLSPSFSGRFGADKDIQSVSPSQTSFPSLPKSPTSLSPTIAPSVFPQPNIGTGFGFTGPLFQVPSIASGADKYTGGFGGAPGVLGNQAKPGYAVQPDGSIKDPDHTYRPPALAVQPVAAPTQAPVPVLPSHSPVATPVKYEKYNGGFGGPPGVLAPYDKH